MNKITYIVLALFMILAPQSSVQASELTPAPIVKEITPVVTPSVDEVLSQTIKTESLENVVAQPKIEPQPALVVKPETTEELAERLVTERFGKGQFTAFKSIVSHESSWNPNAVNPTSGACGLGQALPCSKITDHSVKGQLEWMINYIGERYKTPSIAWYIWQKQGWY